MLDGANNSVANAEPIGTFTHPRTVKRDRVTKGDRDLGDAL